jgi:hypothetical protein
MSMDELEHFVVNYAGDADSRYSIPTQVNVLKGTVYIHVNRQTLRAVPKDGNH